MGVWKVCLYGIDWDDEGELPDNLEVTVEADDKATAIDYALAEAADEFDANVDGTEQIIATPLS